MRKLKGGFAGLLALICTGALSGVAAADNPAGNSPPVGALGTNPSSTSSIPGGSVPGSTLSPPGNSAGSSNGFGAPPAADINPSFNNATGTSGMVTGQPPSASSTFNGAGSGGGLNSLGASGTVPGTPPASTNGCIGAGCASMQAPQEAGTLGSTPTPFNTPATTSTGS